MIALRIHAAPDPKLGWLEVDGKKVEGVDMVVATDHASENQFTFSVVVDKEEGVEIVWDDWEEK